VGARTTSINRNGLFATLCVVGFINGNLSRVLKLFNDGEAVSALVNTLEISVIVWAALIVGVALLRRPPASTLLPADGALAMVAAAAFLVPLAPLSWIAVSGLALRLVLTTRPGSHPHRGACILLAMTIPMFWSRALFALLSDQILAFDAILVAWIGGTERAGNAVSFADGSGYLWIAPACSSIANVSLAILCWVLVTRLVNRRRRPGAAWWAVAACAAVIAVNVTRLSLIDLYSEAFDLLHGPVGSTVANWLTFAAIIGICILGVRHDLTAPRQRLAGRTAGLEHSPQDSR
jgi:hypothetical protein